MSIWQAIQKWRNPTFDWVEDPSVPLVLDLDEGRLCGIAHGEPIERFRFLGRGAVITGAYQFPSKGIVISTRPDGQTIQELMLFFDCPDFPEDGCFAGRFKLRGQSIEPSRIQTEQLAMSLLGEPYWRDEDDSEVILFYERRGFEIQMEYQIAGNLKCILVCQPLMADPEQRESYGVTKPWPPTYD